jgi:hypothetical protein
MGPAAATINALLRAGWKPARPDLWKVEEGLNVEVSKHPFARFQTQARAHHDLQEQVWKRAATHEHGAGLESGIPSLLAARHAMKYLKKHGYFVEARALEYVLVGFFRDPTEETPEHEGICKRCPKRCKATRFHSTYECLDNLEILAEIFQKSAKVIREARSEHKKFPCLWLRGLIPRALLRKKGQASIFEAKLWITENFDKILHQSKLAYSDGTGGEADVPAAIRPVGFGAVTFNYKIENGQPIFEDIEGLGGEVPGEQTVCRAEAWAATIVLSRTSVP